jgi:hypothetical protein
MTTTASGMLNDVFGGFVVFRNLTPADDRLPTFDQLRAELNLRDAPLPRKPEPAYASVVGKILCEARTLSGLTENAAHLIFVGDTMVNDVSAFSNLSSAMGWTGQAFIADERLSQCQEVWRLTEGQQLTVSNQWEDIAEFSDEASLVGIGCDERTVVVADIDKTLLGARGRNDHVIDRARQQAVYEVAHNVVGESLMDETTFMSIYNLINHPLLHPLTEDNQDAVAYACLLVACGLISLDELTSSVTKGQISGFRNFVVDMEERLHGFGRELTLLQEHIREQVEQGNPTPFAAFRAAEYRCTAALMGHLPDHASRDTMLDEEITITEEVWKAIQAWKSRGCMIFGLSDKPDEACLPLPSDTSGAPIHCLRTHIVGGRR